MPWWRVVLDAVIGEIPAIVRAAAAQGPEQLADIAGQVDAVLQQGRELLAAVVVECRELYAKGRAQLDDIDKGKG